MFLFWVKPEQGCGGQAVLTPQLQTVQPIPVPLPNHQQPQPLLQQTPPPPQQPSRQQERQQPQQQQQQVTPAKSKGSKATPGAGCSSKVASAPEGLPGRQARGTTSLESSAAKTAASSSLSAITSHDTSGSTLENVHSNATCVVALSQIEATSYVTYGYT